MPMWVERCALPAEPAPGSQLKYIAVEASGKIPI